MDTINMMILLTMQLTQDEQSMEAEERRLLFSLVWMLMGSKSVDYMFNFEGKQFVSVFFFNPWTADSTFNHI